LFKYEEYEEFRAESDNFPKHPLSVKHTEKKEKVNEDDVPFALDFALGSRTVSSPRLATESESSSNPETTTTTRSRSSENIFEEPSSLGGRPGNSISVHFYSH